MEKTPAFDVFENGEEYVFVADLPGVKQEGLDVQLESDTLQVTGKGETFTYRRNFTLPAQADAEQARAELKAGVLTLHLPKAKTARTRQISVTAA